MNLNKFLSIATVIFSLFVSNSNASVSLDFRSSGNCSISCDNNSKEFSSVKELSHNINEITSKYFTIGSVLCTKGQCERTILLRNFDTTGELFSLSLTYDVPILTNVVFDCMDNNVKFPIIDNLENINNIKIYSDFSENVNFPFNNIAPEILSKCYLNNKPIV